MSNPTPPASGRESVPPITDGGPSPRTCRYDAFISYRHVEPDRTWAKWLHGALETYRVPKELIARGLPKRLTRVFRDEEELPANADLSTQITSALEESKFLIVVCSPRAVESRWVNAEVEHFRKLGRHDRILALLVEGEPGSAFPPALTQIRRSLTDASGQSREEIEEVEPLAADVRPDRTDLKAHTLRGHARLRLLACILGCRFDDLRQRDAERRTRRMKRIGAGLAALVLVLGGLTGYAFLQRNEAVKQKRVAEQERNAAQAFNDLITEDIVQSAVDSESADEALVLSTASRKVPERFKDQPALLGPLCAAFGDALMRAGAARDAVAMYEASKAAIGSWQVDAATRLRIDSGLADARLRQSIDEGQISETRARIAQAIADRGKQDPLVMMLRNNFSGMLKNAPAVGVEATRNLDEAESMYLDVLADRTAVLGPMHLDTLVTRHNIAVVRLRRCRSQFKGLGESPMNAPASEKEAVLHAFRVAIEERRSVTADTQAALGPTHPQTLATLSDQVGLLAEAGRLEPALLGEAIAAYPAVLDALRSKLGFAHWRSLQLSGRYAQALGWFGQDSAAIREWWLTLEGARASLGVTDTFTVDVTAQIVSAFEKTQQVEDAEAVLKRSCDDVTTPLDPDALAFRRMALAEFYDRHNRPDDAARLREAIQSGLGAGSPGN